MIMIDHLKMKVAEGSKIMEDRLRINDNIKTAMMLTVVLYHACMFLLDHGLMRRLHFIMQNILRSLRSI